MPCSMRHCIGRGPRRACIYILLRPHSGINNVDYEIIGLEEVSTDAFHKRDSQCQDAKIALQVTISIPSQIGLSHFRCDGKLKFTFPVSSGCTLKLAAKQPCKLYKTFFQGRYCSSAQFLIELDLEYDHHHQV